MDPAFEEPWAHEARGYRIRYDLTSADEFWRAKAEYDQHVWAYKDAQLRGDDAAAEAAWQAFPFHRTWPGQQPESVERRVFIEMARTELIGLAAGFDDLERAAQVLLEWYPHVDTRDVDTDNERRTDARRFISGCIHVLEREASIGHRCEAAVESAMRDVAARIENELTAGHSDGFRRIGELRARHQSRAAIAQERRSDAGLRGDLPVVGETPPQRPDRPGPAVAGDELRHRGLEVVLGRADAALVALEIHDDPGPLDALVGQLERTGSLPSLRHLLRARRLAVAGDLAAGIAELKLVLRARDRLALRLRPQTHATYGRLLAQQDPAKLDEAIGACRTGRRLGLRWWRRTTAADTTLARLLLWRALREGEPAGQRYVDVREAVRLARRRCRLRRSPGAAERLALQDALAAWDALAGRGSAARRQRAWRRSAGAPASAAERARLAVAWAEWAVGTGDQELAAEAYQHLVSLVPLDATARYRASARRRVLGAAQEHTEEAGYWLARTGKYREAVVALETGRAVGLSQALGPAGSAAERSAPEVRYDDILAATGDGALVYLAAAKTGGYALVVAARNDPQFVALPKLDRATVAGLLGPLVPGATDRSPPVHASALRQAPERDADAASSPGDSLSAGLETLWNSGFRDLVLLHARGRVVTFVPVGLLSLLPLHAVGDLGIPGDELTEWRHVGHFSAVRYAPNARSLVRCWQTARGLPAGSPPLLAVGVPDGFGVDAHGHLAYVARETAEVVRCWAGSATPRNGCMWAEFSAAADAHAVWHLACHGAAEPHAILDSRLYFADRVVTLRELREALPAGRRRLAVLSACESNLTDASLPNEVVGLPSALLQVGFAGVIASSWKVDDRATAYLMTAFYQQWCVEGHEPAVALNLAQQWLRTATRSDLAVVLPGVEPGGAGEYPYRHPRYWAAFAYTGA